MSDFDRLKASHWGVGQTKHLRVTRVESADRPWNQKWFPRNDAQGWPAKWGYTWYVEEHDGGEWRDAFWNASDLQQRVMMALHRRAPGGIQVEDGLAVTRYNNDGRDAWVIKLHRGQEQIQSVDSTEAGPTLPDLPPAPVDDGGNGQSSPPPRGQSGRGTTPEQILMEQEYYLREAIEVVERVEDSIPDTVRDLCTFNINALAFQLWKANSDAGTIPKNLGRGAKRQDDVLPPVTDADVPFAAILIPFTGLLLCVLNGTIL